MINIEDYLVKLGFRVDVVALDSFLNVLDKAKRSLHKTKGETELTAIQIAGNYAKTVAAVAIGIGKMVASVADADQQLGIVAKKYWMTKQAYTEMSYAAEALGYSMDNLNDITLDPELLAQYRELLSVSKQLQPSDEQLSSLKLVRGVVYEIKEGMLSIKYLVMNFSAALAKYLAPETTELRDTIQDINYWLEDMMPEITASLRDIAGPFMRIILQALIGVLKIVRVLLPYALQILSVVGRLFKALEPLWHLLEIIIDGVVGAIKFVTPAIEFLLAIIEDIADILEVILDPIKKLSDIKLFGKTADILFNGTASTAEAATGSTNWYTNSMENNKSINNTTYDTSRKTVSVTNNNNIYAQDATGVATEISKKTEVYMNRYAY